MKKVEKIAVMLAGLPTGETGLDRRYEAYFTCFNTQRYYEAHDVLEHLWLEPGNPDRTFYKGLIQLAAAFVHLQKQFRRPNHPKDATRARPAVRLLELATRNLAPYRPRYLHLDVERVWTLGTTLADQITRTGYANPWTPETAPILTLEPM